MSRDLARNAPDVKRNGAAPLLGAHDLRAALEARPWPPRVRRCRGGGEGATHRGTVRRLWRPGAGVQAVYGGEVAWVSDIDKGANKLLAHRFPGVPNHGDITTIDWSQVEPVDILTGGSRAKTSPTPDDAPA